jgi:glycosyltransferase involved in cell wall biosynthesis/ubiquinone/menaquinone biosynthesis C-methylase UbiE
MKTERTGAYLIVDENLRMAGTFQNEMLCNFTERHKLDLGQIPCDTVFDLSRKRFHPDHAGVVFQMNQGIPGNAQLRVFNRLLSEGCPVFLYWPGEKTIECLAVEDLRCYRSLWILNKAYPLKTIISRLKRFPRSTARMAKAILRRDGQAMGFYAAHVFTNIYEPKSEAHIIQELNLLLNKSLPVPFSDQKVCVTKENPFVGRGIYLRTDFWAKISSGGSYGHTCYVAKELNETSSQFLCIMAHDYSLLANLKVQQLVIPPPGPFGDEPTILQGSDWYYPHLKSIFSFAPPDYIYERICLGNYVGAKISQEFGIPYIVEYNGSEISMRRSFDGKGYEYESLYLKAEELAFKQATAISVVSKHIKIDLIKRGIDSSKIFVNPNGVDTEQYKPLTYEKKRTLRTSLGFSDDHTVVGFTGTFGGWHGVDVLAEAIPEICKAHANIRFLLIGDGNYKALIDNQISTHNLTGQVICAGRVDQEKGRELLGACDMFVSPHNAHMVDSKFFGSPTKIFEYMAMGCGIVSSDLEQIGEVLSPGIRAKELDSFSVTKGADGARAILCSPGDVSEFVNAVLFLAKYPELNKQLGKNAREAAKNIYSWEKHVDRIWQFIHHGQRFIEHEPNPSEIISPSAGLERKKIAGSDKFKEEAQNQWNNDPCGSHYATKNTLHTLDWYLEVEAYRYGVYAPWMPEVMEFKKHSGKKLLEIGAGLGTDLAQFAGHGSIVTDLDLSAGHLELARENFRLRGLTATFLHYDAEKLPFDDNSFDIVYSNGVIHHIPDTRQVIREIYRVLKPGGRAIIMVYAQNSFHYWQKLVIDEGLKNGNLLGKYSMGEIMSRTVEISSTGARPLVKVYSGQKIRRLFGDFKHIQILKRQLMPNERPRLLKWIPLPYVEKAMGWNLIVKADKPEA